MDKPIELRVPKIEYTVDETSSGMKYLREDSFCVIAIHSEEIIKYHALFKRFNGRLNAFEFVTTKGDKFINVESFINGDVKFYTAIGIRLAPESILKKNEVSVWNTDELMIGDAYRIIHKEVDTDGNDVFEDFDAILFEIQEDHLVFKYYTETQDLLQPVEVRDDGKYKVYSIKQDYAASEPVGLRSGLEPTVRCDCEGLLKYIGGSLYCNIHFEDGDPVSGTEVMYALFKDYHNGAFEFVTNRNNVVCINADDLMTHVHLYTYEGIQIPEADLIRSVAAPNLGWSYHLRVGRAYHIIDGDLSSEGDAILTNMTSDHLVFRYHWPIFDEEASVRIKASDSKFTVYPL